MYQIRGISSFTLHSYKSWWRSSSPSQFNHQDVFPIYNILKNPFFTYKNAMCHHSGILGFLLFGVCGSCTVNDLNFSIRGSQKFISKFINFHYSIRLNRWRLLSLCLEYLQDSSQAVFNVFQISLFLNFEKIHSPSILKKKLQETHILNPI